MSAIKHLLESCRVGLKAHLTHLNVTFACELAILKLYLIYPDQPITIAQSGWKSVLNHQLNCQAEWVIFGKTVPHIVKSEKRLQKQRVFITGTAGFIGFHLADLLLQNGHEVAGYDAITDYYDVVLKKKRHVLLHKHSSFSATEAMLEDAASLSDAIARFAPDVIVHLAAQAGVRYSIDNPKAYLDSNIVGTFNVLEAARGAQVKHLLIASTSSVYGANTVVPFNENERVATPLTFYAATKLATEMMGHSYANIYGLPITMFRFFTVYGPWAGLIWPCLNSQRGSSREPQSIFTTMVTCGGTSLT